MWFPKFPYTNFSQINLDWVLRQIKELSEWMNRYFKDIRQDLDDEINNRIEGDKALGERIDKEIQDRTEADNALGARIDKEIQDRTAADTALGARIDQEIQDRTNADTALGQRIDTETAERKAADQQLQNNIDAEKAAREAADTALGDRIDTLRSDAILKDGSTTTTAVIPFAQGIKIGSLAELSPDAGISIEAQLDVNSHKITALANGTDNTDAVNVGQMNTADDQAVSEANSYTDSQLEAFSADVHSIPAGGSSGQVLAKVDGTNYNVTWVDQQGGGSGGDVPAGGTTGQVLAKSSNADYALEWANPTAGPQGPQGPQGPSGEWTLADDYTSDYYNLYESGKLRFLSPKTTKTWENPEFVARGGFQIALLSNTTTYLPVRHYPAKTVSGSISFADLRYINALRFVEVQVYDNNGMVKIKLELVTINAPTNLTTLETQIPGVMYEVE